MNKTKEKARETLDYLLKGENWGEYEPKFVEGLGWTIYGVEDTAGSITLFVTKEKYDEPPYDIEGAYRVKVAYYGMFGNDKGEGCLYYDLLENTYRSKTEFKTFDESTQLLIDKLLELV